MKPPIPILTYHNVARMPDTARSARGLYVSPAAFARQMRLLRMLGFRGLSMTDARLFLSGERHDRVAVITLDDGYLDNLEHALPVLQRHGFTATCYAVSGRSGQYNTWDADRLGVRKPLMSVSQLRSWHEAGMEVGAHTRTHPHLSQCSDDELADEIGGCKAELEDVLGTAVTQFCYPYGDHDDRVVASVRETGFAAATTTQRGRARSDGDPWRLPRVPITRRATLLQVASKLLTGYEDRRA